MPKVLIVEDEAEIAEILVEAFQDAGFLARSAPDGEAALLMLQREKVDAVVTDLRLPTLQGLHFIRILRRQFGPTLPVVVLSGWGSYDEVAGEVDAFMVKPCRPERVIELVRDLICRTPAAV